MVAWCSAALLASSVAAHASAKPVPATLTAEQIVAKNVTARGGVEAWRKIDSMVWVGHMESADPSIPRLSFVLQQKRPNMTRFETSTLAEKSMRIFDGTRGWKVRPNRDGGLDAQPFSPQDLQFARQAQGIDGPLIDYQAKGNTVDFGGVESVEGHKAYRLHVKLPSGDLHDVWIDAKTFLDLKYDRVSYGPTGAPTTVSVMYRNYQTVDGIQVPSTLEIGGGPNTAPARLVIEKIALNPPLDAKAFAKPNEGRKSRMATVDIEPPATDPRQAFGPMAPPGIAAQGSAAPAQ